MEDKAIDPSLDFRCTDKSSIQKREFPVEVSKEYRVFIDPTAYSKMKAHAATTVEVELCGVLIGEVCEDAQGVFLNVVGVIEGEGANNYGAQVTFTHQTWSHINEVKDRDFPEEIIVGWYHTHPGFGVFLSGMDMFIQENFFNQPYQVAIVLETKIHEEGCFVWHEGKSIPVNRYWVGEEEIRLTTGSADTFVAEGMTNSGNPVTQKASVATLDPMSLTGGAPSLLTMCLLVLVGLLLGQFLGSAQMRQQSALVFESEIASIFEFISFNAAAELDFKDSRERVLNIQADLTNGDNKNASSKLRELDMLLQQYANQYKKSPIKYRKDLQALQNRRQSMSDRVNLNGREQLQVKAAVANLYYLRLLQSLGNYDPNKLAEMDEMKKTEVKLYLDQVLQLMPSSKADLQGVFPGLVEFFYQAPKVKPSKQGDKSKKKKKS